MRASARRTRCSVAIAIALAALLPRASEAAPEPITVDCDGQGGGVEGLRAAIAELNDNGGGEIELEEGCTYELARVDNRTRSGANGLPVIRADIAIRTETGERPLGTLGIGIRLGGGDQDPAVITRRSGAPAFRLFEVASGGRLRLDFLDLVGGSAPTGGAIRNNGETLSLTYMAITGATATGPTAHGGAIWSASPVQLTYSDVARANAVGRTAEGGAIWSGGGVALSYSTVSGSVARATEGSAAGGGIYSRRAVDLSFSDVSGNTVSSSRRTAFGGGIFGPAGVELSYSDVKGNTAAGRVSEGGGVYSPRLGVEMSYSSVEGNRPDNCRC